MLWYCGGHGACLTDAGDPNATQDATDAWLRRWLQRDTTVDTGPRVDVIDQHGTRFTGADWPLAAGPPLTADGAGTLSLRPTAAPDRRRPSPARPATDRRHRDGDHARAGDERGRREGHRERAARSASARRS